MYTYVRTFDSVVEKTNWSNNSADLACHSGREVGWVAHNDGRFGYLRHVIQRRRSAENKRREEYVEDKERRSGLIREQDERGRRAHKTKLWKKMPSYCSVRDSQKKNFREIIYFLSHIFFYKTYFEEGSRRETFYWVTTRINDYTCACVCVCVCGCLWFFILCLLTSLPVFIPQATPSLNNTSSTPLFNIKVPNIHNTT